MKKIKKLTDKQVSKILIEKERKYWSAIAFSTLYLLEDKKLIS